MNEGNVSVPRWALSWAVASVPIAILMAFLFGLMAGHYTGPGSNRSGLEQKLCEVFVKGDRSASAETVRTVLLLPTQPAEVNRQTPAMLLPNNFQALDNPALAEINRVGGAGGLWRPDQGLNLQVIAGPEYWLVVIGPRTTSSEPLTRQQLAGLANYFLPLEALTEPCEISMQVVKLTGTQETIGLPSGR